MAYAFSFRLSWTPTVYLAQMAPVDSSVDDKCPAIQALRSKVRRPSLPKLQHSDRIRLNCRSDGRRNCLSWWTRWRIKVPDRDGRSLWNIRADVRHRWERSQHELSENRFQWFQSLCGWLRRTLRPMNLSVHVGWGRRTKDRQGRAQWLCLFFRGGRLCQHDQRRVLFDLNF